MHQHQSFVHGVHAAVQRALRVAEDHPHGHSATGNEPFGEVSQPGQYIDLLQICVNPSNAEATFVQSTIEDARIFENHLNPFMLVFIG